MDSKRKQAVGYVRVSTTMQAETGQSLDSQKDDIIRYCLYKNYDFIKHYTDEAKSGKNTTDREQLQLMMEELQPGHIIVTKSLSRLSRSVKDIMLLMEQIKAKGASIVFLDLDIDTSTPGGDLMLNVMGAIAQFERKNTADKVSNTLNHMSREGKLIKKPRFGYKVVKDGKISTVVEEPDEQIVINRIKSLIEEDPKITLTHITRVLTNENVKIRKSKKIYPDMIGKIIKANNLR